MAPDPEGFLKDLMPTKDDWRILVGGIGSLNAGWFNGMISKWVPEDWKAQEAGLETAGAIASWTLYKLLPRWFKGTIGEAAKSFFLGTLFSNVGIAGKKYVPQLEFKVVAPAGMPEQPTPPPPEALPAPRSLAEYAALEAQTSVVKYFGK